MGSLKNYMKKVNDIALKFYAKVYLCEIALIFFILSANHVNISMIESDLGNNWTIVAIIYNWLLESVLYMKK